jgi:flagellar biosynthesis/type III secretory pathway M-ring protein FliF/YscJ
MEMLPAPLSAIDPGQLTLVGYLFVVLRAIGELLRTVGPYLLVAVIVALAVVYLLARVVRSQVARRRAAREALPAADEQSTDATPPDPSEAGVSIFGTPSESPQETPDHPEADADPREPATAENAEPTATLEQPMEDAMAESGDEKHRDAGSEVVKK